MAGTATEPLRPVTDAINAIAAKVNLPLDLAADLIKAIDGWGAHRAAIEREGLRAQLREHYLAQVICDHGRQMDNPVCACSLVNLGWHPSVGHAVEAWIEHVLDTASLPNRKD